MPQGRLLSKMLVSTLLPSAIAIFGLGVAAHETARTVLEDELGRRVGAAAAGIAMLVLPDQLSAIGAGDEGSNTYANLRRRAREAKEQLDLRRVLFVARDMTSRTDTDDRVALGAVAYELGADKPELERAAGGRPISAPLFWGLDGLPYKRGYARVGQAGFVVVEASAGYFQALAGFRRWLLAGGAAAMVFIMALAIWFSRRMTGPLERLAIHAERIGEGKLSDPVPVETKNEIGYLAARLDEMRSALAARDERMRMMLAGIAHEVRNPLGGLELFAGLLREGLAGNPDRLSEVARIEREIATLKTVVNDFLDFARRPAPMMEPWPARELLIEVSEVVTPAGAMVRVECAADLVVSADRGQIRRALVNLAKNAVAAAPAGTVVLAARPTADRVAFAVRDSGPGIPGTDREKIFTPFFTTREKGTGLGLAFVREIARDHGSEPWVETAPEGGALVGFSVASAG